MLSRALGTFCPYRKKLALMLPESILPGRWQALGQRLSPSSSVCLVLYSTESPLLFPHKHAQGITHRAPRRGSARRFLRPATHHKQTGIGAGRLGTTNPLAHQGLRLAAVLLRTISSSQLIVEHKIVGTKASNVSFARLTGRHISLVVANRCAILT